MVTPTRRRPHLIGRAIESVANQCCRHVSEHVVLVDDCPSTWSWLGRELPSFVRPRFVPRGPRETGGPARAAKLRDIGTSVARTRWVAYLDDDNEWESNHLHTLLSEAIESACPAVYSWAQVFHRDGTPYLDEVNPWSQDLDSGRAEYARLRKAGVVTPGSHVYRDRLDLFDGEDAIRSVDQSAWLLETDLVRRITFSNTSIRPNREEGLAEDDIFNLNLVAEGIGARPTELATLRYYLGGYSTAPEQNEPADW
ncbi:glycosyltransferase family A protein [Plantactinospora sp. B6F1]|uniref:glycosyltransferase family A protein n=1 Tax=Plantactinospora sp. B6F1 TaxID=3158971 RepID=UPI0032D93A04